MMDEDEEHPSVVGILGCIETGTAHLSEEERKKWSEDAEPNLLLVDQDEAND